MQEEYNWEIRLYNQWIDQSGFFQIFGLNLHNCGKCFGFDLFLLGFGFAIRFDR